MTTIGYITDATAKRGQFGRSNYWEGSDGLYEFVDTNDTNVLKWYVLSLSDPEMRHYLNLLAYSPIDTGGMLLKFPLEWKRIDSAQNFGAKDTIRFAFQYMFLLYAFHTKYGLVMSKIEKRNIWRRDTKSDITYRISTRGPADQAVDVFVVPAGFEIAIDPIFLIEGKSTEHAQNLRDLGKLVAELTTERPPEIQWLIDDLMRLDVLDFGIKDMPYGADSGIFHASFKDFYTGTSATGVLPTLRHVLPPDAMGADDKYEYETQFMVATTGADTLIVDLETKRLAASSKPAAPPASTPTKPPSSVLTTDTRAKRLEELRPHMEKLIAAYRDPITIIKADYSASLTDTRFRNAYTDIAKIAEGTNQMELVKKYPPDMGKEMAYDVYTSWRNNEQSIKYAAFGLLLLATKVIYLDEPIAIFIIPPDLIETIFKSFVTRKDTPSKAQISFYDDTIKKIEQWLAAPIGDAAVRTAIAEFDTTLVTLKAATTIFDVESAEKNAEGKQAAVTAAYNDLDDVSKATVQSEVERVEKTDVNTAAYTRLVTLLNEAIANATAAYNNVISAPDLMSAEKAKPVADNQYITAKGLATAAGNHATDKSAITAKMAPLEKTKEEAEARITTLKKENATDKTRREQEEKERREKARDAYVAALAEIDNAGDLAAVKAAIARAEDARNALFPLEDSDRIISHAIAQLKVLLDQAAKASAAEYEKIVPALGIDASKAAYAVARATDKDVDEITAEITRIDPSVKVDTILASLEAAKKAARANLKESPDVALLKEIEEAKTSNAAWASRLETKVVPSDPIRQNHLKEALQLIKAANSSSLTQHEIRKHLLLVRLGKVL